MPRHLRYRTCRVAMAVVLVCASCTGTISTASSQRAEPAMPAVEAPGPATPEPEPTAVPTAEAPTAEPTATDAPVEADSEDTLADPAAEIPEDQAQALAHPSAEALPAIELLEERFGGGTWELDSAIVIVPGPTEQTTCEEPDPPFMDGINVKFQSITHQQYVLVQIQRGEDATRWGDMIVRFPNCPFYGVGPTDLAVPDSEQSVVLTTTGPSPDGFWSMASGTSGEDFVLVIGGAYAEDANSLNPERLADLTTEILNALPA